MAKNAAIQDVAKATMVERTTTVTSECIRAAIESLGIGPGDAIAVHGSLKRFGHVEGGAAAVVDALIEAVGPEGLVTMPVYASSVDACGDLAQEPARGAPVSTGIIPATLGRDPRAVLARHPLYAYAFYGRDAEALACGCERLLVPYGKDQPLTCLFARRGFIVQVGVDDVTNTSIHVAEELADPAYLADKKAVSGTTVEGFFRLPVESRRTILARHRTGPRRDFSLCTPLIVKAGLRRSVVVGNATVAVTEFAGMCNLLTEALRRNPELMLQPAGRQRQGERTCG